MKAQWANQDAAVGRALVRCFTCLTGSGLDESVWGGEV